MIILFIFIMLFIIFILFNCITNLFI